MQTHNLIFGIITGFLIATIIHLLQVIARKNQALMARHFADDFPYRLQKELQDIQRHKRAIHRRVLYSKAVWLLQVISSPLESWFWEFGIVLPLLIAFAMQRLICHYTHGQGYWHKAPVNVYFIYLFAILFFPPLYRIIKKSKP